LGLPPHTCEHARARTHTHARTRALTHARIYICYIPLIQSYP
jgi:hypothetical protein